MTYDDDSAEELLDRLRTLSRRVDPVPEAVKDAASASFRWRATAPYAELATLVYDSSLQALDTRAAVRSQQGGRELTFEAPHLTVEVDVVVSTWDRRLIGQLVPPQRASIEVRHPGGSFTVDADEIGRFAADNLPAGPVSLRCTVPGQPPTDTEWTVV